MNNIKKITLISVFSALSVVFYVLGPKFPLPIFPSFLEVNFSMLPIFILLFMMGYKEALVALVIRMIIKFIFGTHTFGIGETTDFIVGFVTIMFAFVGEKLFKDKAKGIYVFLFAILGWIVGGIIGNTFALPMYDKMFGDGTVMKMMSSIGNVNESNYVWKYFIICIIPFNLILAVSVSVVTFLLNIRLRPLYLEFVGENKGKINLNTNDEKDL